MTPFPAVLFVTGATGLIGSAVVERALATGVEVRALVRGDDSLLSQLAAGKPGRLTVVRGSLEDAMSLRRGLDGARAVVHCAAKVGDWGDTDEYRRLNVFALRAFLEAAKAAKQLERFVMMSSLGVYAPRDHFGTDESGPPYREGFDAYTRTKAEAEDLARAASLAGLPVVILRPGFTYGPRDRHVLPALAMALRQKRLLYFGKGEQKLDQTGVRNLVDATMLALKAPAAIGETFNITDDPLVTRREFVGAVARGLGIPEPRGQLPRWAALPLATLIDGGARLVGMKDAPPLSMARYKFMALNLEFSIAKAQRVLGYKPSLSFADGIDEAVRWYRENLAGRRA